jgi:Tol biopolymer transport system component
MSNRFPASAAFAIVVTLSFIGSTAVAAHHSEWSEATNLGATVNSSFDDSGPGLSKDGLSLYFTSTRPGFGGEDIWVSQRASERDPWGTPANLGPTINTAGFERAPAFSRDGHWMFFGSSRPGGVAGSFDIWASWREFVHDDFGWQAPVNVGPGINTAFTDNAPAFLEIEDGSQFIYFTSNRPGGPGDFDLYMSTRFADGTWGPADPIVELNTSANEARPAIRRDGLEIFFQSNRPGSAFFDLWSATRTTSADGWSAPINLGAANSGSADVQPTISSDQETLIFASARTEGFGGLDLYVSTRTKLHGKR